MTPDTVHLLANLIRHQRAMMTSIEKWVGKQTPSPTNLELSSVTSLMRQVLDTYEWQLSQVDTKSEDVPEKVSRFRR